MKKRITILPSNFQCERDDLLLPALHPETVRIDGLTRRQQLAFCAKLAGVINYYKSSGKKDGQWSELIVDNLPVFTAVMLEKDVDSYLKDFTQYYQAVVAAEKPQLNRLFLQNFFKSVFMVFLQVNEWYLQSKQQYEYNAVHQLLSDEIAETGKYLLRSVYKVYFSYCESNPGFRNQGLKEFSVMASRWNFEPFPFLTDEEFVNGRSLNYTLIAGRREGEPVFTWLNDLLGKISVIHEDSLKADDIKPHVGLLLTFLKLQEHTIANLNALTKDHIRFFYSDVLGLSPEPARADETFISVQTAKGVTEALITEGTGFLASTDQENDPVIFEACKNTEITSTEINGYKTFYFDRPPEADHTDLKIYTSDIKDYAKPSTANWLMMKGEKSGRIPVRMGFAFSSPDLLMAEGERYFKITFSLTSASVCWLKSEGLNSGDLNDLFRLLSFEVSGPKGWFRPQLLDAKYLPGRRLSMSFSVCQPDPSVVSYSSKVHGEGFDSEWPILKATTDGPGYEVLSNLKFDQITLGTTVSAISNLIIANDFGKLKTGGVFMPFGSAPMPEDSWYVGYYEMFVKPLSSASLTLHWHDLPSDFAEYYKNYTTEDQTDPFSNNAFRMNVAVLNHNQWQTLPPLTDVPLFTDSVSSSVIEDEKSILIPGSYMPCNPFLKAYDSLQPELSSGFLKFTLSAPAEGFGKLIYPQAISTVTMENGLLMIKKRRRRDPDRDKPFKATPKQPFIPQIDKLSLSYRSENTFNQKNHEDWQWYHMAFEGVSKLDNELLPLSFVTGYKQQSYAYLGLNNLPETAELDLLVSVVGSGTNTISDNSDEVSYEIFTTSGWQMLEVYGDSTSGLQNIGIVNLKIPGNVKAAFAFGDTLYRIRIGTTLAQNTVIDFIANNGVKVARKFSKSTKEIVPISAATIIKTENPDEKLGAIAQPAPSFGGLSAEDEKTFFLNTAHRLNNKNRMESKTDINQLLLTKIPELFSVRTVPMIYTDPELAGTSMIYLTSYEEADSPSAYRPVTPPVIMREALNLVKTLAARNVRYEISNLKPVELVVTCRFTVADQNQARGIIAELNDDLKLFLSPWIRGNEEGARRPVSRYSLYRFIESRPYIKTIVSLECELSGHREVSVTKPNEFKVGSTRLTAPVSHEVGKSRLRQESDRELQVRPEEMIVSAEKHLLSVVSGSGVLETGASGKIGELIIKN